MQGLTIEYHDPRSLVPYERNARRHGEEDIEAIRRSIREFGFNDPVGIWSSENIIVEGHGRREAAILEGLDSVPCIRLDNLTDEERRAYALAHNKTAELSFWDAGKLNKELEDIFGVDMEAVGAFKMSDEDYDSMFAEAPEKEKKPRVYICPHCGAEVTA